MGAVCLLICTYVYLYIFMCPCQIKYLLLEVNLMCLFLEITAKIIFILEISVKKWSQNGSYPLTTPFFFTSHDNYIKTLEVTNCQSMGLERDSWMRE